MRAQIASGFNEYAAGFAAGARPRPRELVSAWADANRVLTRVASNEDGKWRTRRTPYLREPMDCLSPLHPAQKVVLKFATQTGKTEILLNAAGCAMDTDPGPMMWVQPTLGMAKKFSRRRLQPMIEASPALCRLVAPVKSRDSGNTVLEKSFPGGFCNLVGAQSSTDLRMVPIRYAYLDEVAEYPEDLDDQGGVDDLVDRRQSSFGRRRKCGYASTPTLEDCCPLDAQWKKSDQRELYVECTDCGGWSTVLDLHLQDDALRACPDCGALRTEAECKSYWYAPEAPEPRYKWIPHNPESTMPGFHLASWYAAFGLGYTWEEIVEIRREARGNPIKAKTYRNTIEALTYADENAKVDIQAMLERREDWRMREPPPGCLRLTAGVDIQGNRFAIGIWGWGRGEQCWLIDYIELPADPTDPKSWDSLADYLAKPIRNAHGYRLPVEMVAVDSGNWTREVYQFVRPRQVDGYIAIKGSSQSKRPVLGPRPSLQDVGAGRRVDKTGVALWHVGTDTAKTTLLARMKADEEESDHRHVHFPEGVPKETLEQLTSERWDQTRRRFRVVVGMRNEGLDCFVYSYAAAHHPSIRIHLMSEADWDSFADTLEPAIRDMFSASPGSEPEPQEPAQASGEDRGEAFIQSRHKGGSFIQRRR